MHSTCDFSFAFDRVTIWGRCIRGEKKMPQNKHQVFQNKYKKFKPSQNLNLSLGDEGISFIVHSVTKRCFFKQFFFTSHELDGGPQCKIIYLFESFHLAAVERRLYTRCSSAVLAVDSPILMPPPIKNKYIHHYRALFF